MASYPNRDALREAHDIYLNAMKSFIIECLKVSGGAAEKIVIGIEDTMEVADIPHLVQKYWEESFKQYFTHIDRYYEIRGVTWVIKEGRNRASHPPWDLDPEFTQTHLFLIANLLEKIDRPDAKRRIENIQDRLFSDNIARQTEEIEQAAYKKRLETMSTQLARAVAEKAGAEERLSDMSNQLEEVEAENAAYKKRIETIQGQLEAANAEKTLKAASNRSATQKNSAELEDLLESLKEDVKVKTERQNEKVVAPRPAPDFPYTGSQLRDYRKKAGLTQVAVALALGLSEGSAAAVADWEADRVNVPSKHHTKLKKFYGIEVSHGSGADEESVYPNEMPVTPSYSSNTAKSPKKKQSIAERYAAETTEEECNELAVKIAELRINEEGTKPLAWRKIREELGLKNDEFHLVIRPSAGYREAVVNRIKSLKASKEGWEYSGKLEFLTGIKIAESELK